MFSFMTKAPRCRQEDHQNTSRWSHVADPITVTKDPFSSGQRGSLGVCAIWLTAFDEYMFFFFCLFHICVCVYPKWAVRYTVELMLLQYIWYQTQHNMSKLSIPAAPALMDVVENMLNHLGWSHIVCVSAVGSVDEVFIPQTDRQKSIGNISAQFMRNIQQDVSTRHIMCVCVCVYSL